MIEFRSDHACMIQNSETDWMRARGQPASTRAIAVLMIKVKYEGVLYNTASEWTLPSLVTAPLVLRRQ